VDQSQDNANVASRSDESDLPNGVYIKTRLLSSATTVDAICSMSVAKTATPEMAEDEIDLESLQAQIDLSMSFAQDLVSTWVSTKSSSTSRNQKLERELQEYIRRPPR